MDNTETVDVVGTTDDQSEKKTGAIAWLKENATTIATSVGTIAIAGIALALDQRRSSRKEQAYYGYLEEKLELHEEALGSYKDSLGSAREDGELDNRKDD